jgi:hypothetical protein
MTKPYCRSFIFLFLVFFLFSISTPAFAENLHDFLAKFEIDDLLHFGYGGFLGGWVYKKTEKKSIALSSVIAFSIIKEIIDKHETGRFENSDIALTTFGACIAIYF